MTNIDLIEHNFKDLIINKNRTDGIKEAEKKIMIL